jgi:cytoskeletal protein RodZ
VDTASAEKLRSVAQQLVQAREAQGISLEEIATKTFIPMRALKALESGETFKLPEPIFVQGFIRRYAKLVGLDGDALAKEIPLNTEPVAVDLIKEAPRPPLVDVIRNQLSKAPVPDKVMRPVVLYGAENPVSSKSDGYGANNSQTDRPTWLFPVLGGLLGFGLLAGAIALLRPQTPEVKQTNQSPSTKPIAIQSSPKPNVVPSPIASETPSSSIKPSPTSSPSVTSGPVKVDVSLTDRSWIEVVVDGDVKFDGMMEKGVTQSWSGQKDVQISSGNAGAVKLVYNQSPAVVMGKAGQVETKKFSAKN